MVYINIQARTRVLARVERLAAGNPGDVKPVGKGLSELRIDKALSGKRTPNFDTILKVIKALGLRLHAKATSFRHYQ